MAEPTRGMGRGLSAILLSSAEEAQRQGIELRDVPVDLIHPNRRQPRRYFDESKLTGLADSLRERGVLQPVLVRPQLGGTYELIAGERRWRAARLAGFDTIPSLVRAQDESAALELALIENMAREDLNPVEEARACGILVEELGLTREDLGRRIGRSRAAVSNLLRLLELPEEALDLLTLGRLSAGHGRALLMAPEHDDRRRLARLAADEALSVRQTEEHARALAGRRPRDARRRSTRHHPDREEAAARLSGAFGRLFGADVRVAPSGRGYRLSLNFASLDEALEIAERLGALEPA